MSEQIDRLIVHYQKALLIKPDNAEIYINLAELYYKRGQLDKTVTACETALKIQPTLTGISKTLAGVLQQRGEVDAAFEMYNALGERLVKEGKLEEAIAVYHCAIEVKPSAYQAYYRLGEIFQRQWKLEEAISCCLKAIEIEPLFIEAHYNLIEYYRVSYSIKYEIENPLALEKAVRCYRYVIQNYPNFDLAYIGLGDLLTYQGNLAEAISCYHNACYRQILQTRPNFAKNYWDTKNPRHPHFLIIGAGKGGTSSLYAYLTEHPNILPAIRKEVGLSREIFDKGVDYYLSYFPPIPKQSIFLTGEATPWYFYSQSSSQKLALIFPNIKLILILRNPVIRAFSHYKMLVNYGSEQRAFAEVIASEIEHLSSDGEDKFTYWQTEKGYLLLGWYFHFIKKWMAVFPREQFLILRSEDFYANPAATLTQVFEFLGVPDYPLPEYPNYNPGSYNPISDDLRQTLAEFFRPHNQKLEEYLGMKFDWD
ncbi:tetratricopeptide repeat protein [Microcoleus sp. LAD1_D3]|uniref:tetratricopeptide repeat protein n=1 Tax=Microcoleus sp. LAD1_D3 TaxID=2819365 RepID=UPI002FD36D4B